jgi:hypothetical protein
LDRGRQLFVGGQVGSDTLTQTDSLAAAAGAIDAGEVSFTLDGWLGGNGLDTSAASVTLTFLAANAQALGSATIGPVTVTDRLGITELDERSVTAKVPAGARFARVALTLNDGTPPNLLLANSYNDAYADNLSLRISAPVAAPAPPRPPASRIGRLDHVFMVFMENEGLNDILGSTSAPYLNSLIRRHGLATDYHGVEHPSDDNYVAFFGGSTFGIDTNCAPGCAVNERNLADEVEAAGKTWSFYEETMPSSCYLSDYGPRGSSGSSYYTPDLLPWSYFTDLLDNMPRCHAHDFPLARLPLDLAGVRTTPNYVWFEPDDCDDMEQCGIAAGDAWLSRTVPEILRSAAFKTRRSAIFITWDEDYNNKTINQDNQDNRVPMIVIGSRRSGILPGPVRDPDGLTHYSLLRTIELALGLPTLTRNDRFATPLNGFWPAVPRLSALHVTRSRGGTIVLHYDDSAASATTISIYRTRHSTRLRFIHRDRAGANAVALPRWLRRRLEQGAPYTVRASASNAAGVRSAPVTARFIASMREQR